MIAPLREKGPRSTNRLAAATATPAHQPDAVPPIPCSKPPPQPTPDDPLPICLYSDSLDIPMPPASGPESFDIFVSYSRADDANGLIAQFVECLRREVEQSLAPEAFDKLGDQAVCI